MINQEVLKEKLQYLIKMNSAQWFDIEDVYLSFDYTDESHEMIMNYDLDVTFDYHGRIDLELSGFIRDVEKMSNELQEYLSEFVITQDGKIVSGKNSNVSVLDHPMIFKVEYKADELHKFILGYRFIYE
jgi:hypothetical protein